MTIKQNGGIFGRNPTFNDVTVEGEFTSSNLNIDNNKLYVDPNNVRVGINTDSPDTIFEIRGPDPILTIRDTDTGSATANATLRLAETGASDSLDAYWDIKATNGFLHFIDNWNEGGGTGTRISFLDGGGIAFNGDTAAANALSDYEQGSWTPALTGPASQTYTSSGYYVKIGSSVLIQGIITWTVAPSGGSNYRVALPFGSSTDKGDNINFLMVGLDTAASAIKYLSVYQNSSNAYFRDTNGTAYNYAGLIGTGSLSFSGMYSTT